jgi:hypothetical protein
MVPPHIYLFRILLNDAVDQMSYLSIIRYLRDRWTMWNYLEAIRGIGRTKFKSNHSPTKSSCKLEVSHVLEWRCAAVRPGSSDPHCD